MLFCWYLLWVLVACSWVCVACFVGFGEFACLMGVVWLQVGVVGFTSWVICLFDLLLLFYCVVPFWLVVYVSRV